MQELRSFLSEAREDWKIEGQKLENKFDEIIQLEREKLALEKEKLEFERQKLGLSKNKNGPQGTLSFSSNLILWHSTCLFLYFLRLFDALCQPSMMLGCNHSHQFRFHHDQLNGKYFHQCHPP